jgi:hypothetical protein
MRRRSLGTFASSASGDVYLRATGSELADAPLRPRIVV